MAVSKNHRALLKKLKKQVSMLQRKEKQTRDKLHSALKKMRKIGRVYKTKLANKMRMMKAKLAEGRALTYAKVAVDLERQLLKGIENKAKALAKAASKVEKQHAAKLAKSLAKKGRVRKRA